MGPFWASLSESGGVGGEGKAPGIGLPFNDSFAAGAFANWPLNGAC